MKRVVPGVVLLLLGIGVGFGLAVLLRRPLKSMQAPGQTGAAKAEVVTITLSAIIDGSERFIFTGDNVWNEHGRWQPPREVVFNGESWQDLTVPPAQWEKLGPSLDLAKAELVQRKGRDMIALEKTAEGFDLYLADTQMGGAPYEVTIAIPKRSPRSQLIKAP